MRSHTRTWLVSAGLIAAGLLLMWWASEQRLAWQSIFTAEFRTPVVRIMLWLATVAAAGFSWGLAVAASRRGRGGPRIQVMAVLTLAPLTAMLYFFSWIMGWGVPTLPMSLDVFLLTEPTQVAFALLLGFLVSGMIGLDSPAEG